jgi:acetyl esterase/lipase
MRRAALIAAGRPALAGLFAGLFATLAFGAEKFSESRDVTYVERGSGPLKADIFVPAGDGPFPAVLVVHGGAWMSGNKGRMTGIATALAEHGYTACAINYRLAPKDPFPAQIEDCKAAIRFLRKNAATYKIDPGRIAGFGYSAGAHLVALLGVTDPTAGLEGADVPAGSESTRIQAVVAGGAPCEFRVLPADNQRLAYWLGGTRAEKPQAYELASPLRFVSKDDPPFFFFHGAADNLVPLASPQEMVKQLTNTGVHATLLTVPGAGHGQTLHDPSVMAAVLEFLDKNLKKSS